MTKDKYSIRTFWIIIIAFLIGGWNNCNGQTVALMPNDGYWYTWDTDDGILYDDGYQGNYKNNGLGALTVYPLTPGTITLSFLFMDIESHPSCAYDYLEVYHGETFDSLVGRYCGTALPPVMTSTDPTGSFTFLWSSDFSVPRPGFIIEIKNAGFSLPIVLTSFTGVERDKKVFLEFVVQSQVNNDYFTIEKSRDCYQWEFVHQIEGAGNTNSEMRYSLLDEDSWSNLSYYRLSQTDHNGDTEIFPPIAVIIKENSKKVWKTINIHGQEVDRYYKGAVIDVYYDYTYKKRIQ